MVVVVVGVVVVIVIVVVVGLGCSVPLCIAAQEQAGPNRNDRNAYLVRNRVAGSFPRSHYLGGGREGGGGEIGKGLGVGALTQELLRGVLWATDKRDAVPPYWLYGLNILTEHHLAVHLQARGSATSDPTAQSTSARNRKPKTALLGDLDL